MSGFGEAFGTAAEGGLFARAISKQDASHKESAGHFHESACLNCHTQLLGDHCHQCGQPAHLHRTLSALWHDIAHGVLHMEGKTWKTLPMLAWKPGELTRRYVHGERARFVSPMALFLFSVFLMFAVFQAVGITTPTDFTTTDQIKASFKDLRESTAERQKNLTEKIAAMESDDPDRAEAEEKLAEVEDAMEGFKKISPRLENGDGMVQVNTMNTGIPFIDHGLEKWNKNPGLMLYKMQTNSYKFSWLLIPLSVPFVWLLFFWKRGIRAYDHAIFVTYSLAFMSLLFVALSIALTMGMAMWAVATLATTIPTYHIYRHLRGAYSLGKRQTIWRLLVLLFFIQIVIVLFLNILLVLGAL